MVDTDTNEVWTGLMDFQSSQPQVRLLLPRPVLFVRSDGLRFAMPMKN
jgi:hypothetical protein